MADFINGIHYYMDGVKVVFTEQWHIHRGECCGSKCKHCPFVPKHKEGSVVVAEEFLKFKDKISNGDR